MSRYLSPRHLWLALLTVAAIITLCCFFRPAHTDFETEITSITVSPDGTRAVLTLYKSTNPKLTFSFDPHVFPGIFYHIEKLPGATTTGLLDLTSMRMLKDLNDTNNKSDWSPCQERVWSSDSRWYILGTDDKTISLLERNGGIHGISTSHAVDIVSWSPIKPANLVYVPNSSPTYGGMNRGEPSIAYMFDVMTGDEQRIGPCANFGLTVANGHCCSNEGQPGRALLRDIFTGKIIFTLPLYTFEDSGRHFTYHHFLQLSPDGKYFLLEKYYNEIDPTEDDFYLLARTAEAAVVLRNAPRVISPSSVFSAVLLRRPPRAIAWERAQFKDEVSLNLEMVLWPPSKATGQYADVAYYAKQVINLRTGVRLTTLGGIPCAKIHAVDRWPGHGFLVITDRGLENVGENGATQLLLRHKMQTHSRR